jgi:FMN reductase
MTPTTTTGGAPLVVGLGGTLRANSSTERAMRYCLEAVERQGGRTTFFSGPDLDLPMYAPHELDRTPKALELVGALRDADAAVVGSPGYHGAWPTPLGVAINSADHIWDDAGRLADSGVQGHLDMLATQLLTFARAACETA